MAVPALLDLIQVLFRGPVVFHELGRVVLAVVLDEKGNLRVGILHNHVHGLDVPAFLLDPGQVEPEIVLGIELLDGDFQPVAWRGQEHPLLDAGHRHPVSLRFQLLELGRVPAGESERLQLGLLQAGTRVGSQVQVAIIDDGIDVHCDAGRQGPAEVLLAGEDGDRRPILSAAPRGVGEDRARLRVEGEEGGFLEVLDLDVHDGPGTVFRPFLPAQGDGYVDVAHGRFRLVRFGLPAGSEGEENSQGQCD